jgi:hypothetical protein
MSWDAKDADEKFKDLSARGIVPMVGIVIDIRIPHIPKKSDIFRNHFDFSFGHYVGWQLRTLERVGILQ